MKITNVSPAARTIAATGQSCEAGETIEVDDDLGASLCEQVDVWAKAQPTPKASKQEDDK